MNVDRLGRDGLRTFGDTAIAIRTAVLKDGQLHVQAGAGVVADSDPQSEWTETMNKARAVMRAATEASGASS